MLQGKDWEFSQNSIAIIKAHSNLLLYFHKCYPMTPLGQDTAYPSIKGTTPLFLAKTENYPSLTCDRHSASILFHLKARRRIRVSWQSCMELWSTSWSICIRLGSAGLDQAAHSSVTNSAFSLGTECLKLKTSALVHHVTGNFPTLLAFLCKEA